MPAVATSRLRLIKQETYSNPDAWGVYLNSGALDMADQAFGVAEIAVGANVSLDTQNFVSDEARHLVLILSGAGGFSVTAPAVDKPYLVINDCAADVTIGPFGGTFATVRAGTAVWYTTNAAGTVGRVIDPTLDKVRPAAGPVDFNGQRAVNGADAVDPTDFTTLQQIEPFADAAAQSAANALASEQATQALYDDFQKRYLGPHPTPPTVDELGDPLEPGAIYYDTVADSLFVYDGADWALIDIPPFASKAQAETGTDNATVMSPLRVAEAFAAFYSGAFVGMQVFTSAGTYTPHAKARSALVFVTGGGGGGPSASGGSAGGTAISRLSALAITAITVGAAGVSGGSATAGGQSSFGSLVIATGGGANGAAPGVGTSGDILLAGGRGVSIDSTPVPGVSFWGGGYGAGGYQGNGAVAGVVVVLEFG
jgi:hypothetical protein